MCERKEPLWVSTDYEVSLEERLQYTSFFCSCSKFPSLHLTTEVTENWSNFAPIAKLDSLDEIDQDNSRHSMAQSAAPPSSSLAAADPAGRSGVGPCHLAPGSTESSTLPTT